MLSNIRFFPAFEKPGFCGIGIGGGLGRREGLGGNEKERSLRI